MALGILFKAEWVVVCLFTSVSVLSMWMSVSVFLRERERETDVDRKVGVKYCRFVHLNASKKERKTVKDCWKCCCVLGSRERDEKGEGQRLFL